MSSAVLESLFDSLVLAEIEDAEEETFLLFSSSIPSQNLGFLDSKATILDLTINDRDLSIHQSPTILSSTRDGGTTGAVVWKITPLISTWLLSPLNPLSTNSFLTPTTTILELGCGISGITALSISPKVGTYILTDQQYIMKYLRQNLDENQKIPPATKSSTTKKSKKGGPQSRNWDSSDPASNIIITLPLDWELSDIPATLSSTTPKISQVDIILACDCIYNSHLVKPLVATCAKICKYNPTNPPPTPGEAKQTIVVIAQQLRSPEIFEEWLREFMQEFRVWRVEDEGLIEELRVGEGFVVHVGVLR